jgi:hypothetical protein
MKTLMVSVLAVGLMAIVASAARADTFACVNNSSGTVKVVPSCTVGTNASPCHNNDTCKDLSTSKLSVGVTCNTQSVGAVDGSFNIDATCPSGDVVVTGGWSCVDGTGNVTDATISENTFFFSNITPVGWQTVGHATAHDGSCTVCASCTPGACKDDPNDCLP